MRGFLAIMCATLMVIGVGNLLDSNASVTKVSVRARPAEVAPLPPVGQRATVQVAINASAPACTGRACLLPRRNQTTVTANAADVTVSERDGGGPVRTVLGRACGIVGKVIGRDRRQGRLAARQ